MKRFLAFAGPQYYPETGMLNFVGDFDSMDEALGKAIPTAKESSENLHWYQVFDSETNAIITWTKTFDKTETDVSHLGE